eukprot:542373-Pyramimonas_sp.AAC.1
MMLICRGTARKGEGRWGQRVRPLKTCSRAALAIAARRRNCERAWTCLLYTSDAADDTPCVDL